MKRLSLAILVLGAIFLGAGNEVRRAECATCPRFKCYGEGACGPQCSCVTFAGESGGMCVSIERASYEK